MLLQDRLHLPRPRDVSDASMADEGGHLCFNQHLYLYLEQGGATIVDRYAQVILFSEVSAAGFVLTVGGGHSHRRAAALSHFLRRGWHGRVQVVSSKKMCGKNIVRLRAFGLSCLVSMQLFSQPAAVKI